MIISFPPRYHQAMAVSPVAIGQASSTAAFGSAPLIVANSGPAWPDLLIYRAQEATVSIGLLFRKPHHAIKCARVTNCIHRT